MNSHLDSTARQRMRMEVAGVRRRLRITWRLVSLRPLPIAAAAGGVLVWRAKLDCDAADLVLAVAVAIGLSTVLADQAAVTLAASPTTLRQRTASRLIVTLPVAGVCRLTAGLVALHSLPRDTRSWAEVVVPGRQAWLVLAVMVALVLGVEARSATSGIVAGMGGSVTALVVLPVVLRLPDSLAVLPLERHVLRWTLLLVLLLIGLCSALADPGLRLRASRFTRWG